MGGQIEPLDAESYRVIAIDSRGTGKSSNTAPVLTYEMMSDDVVGVMDALKIERADIVGWSDGGNLGLDLARRYPDRIRKVRLAPTTLLPPTVRTPCRSRVQGREGGRRDALADTLHVREELTNPREVAGVVRAGAHNGL